jgi:DNA-binding transcriptional ArsR family regulator
VPDVFQILADPTRRRLVDALRNGERSVSELVEAVDIGQPGVSRQLGVLQNARFVAMRPEGRRRLYSLRPEPFQELDQWMLAYRAMWEDRLDRFAAELDRRGKSRPKTRRNTNDASKHADDWDHRKDQGSKC